MLKHLKERWWLYSGIIIFLIIRSIVEPFKSNRLSAMAAAVVIGIVIAVLVAIISARSSPSTGKRKL